MLCLGFEPCPQDGRRRQNHGAVVAAQAKVFFLQSHQFCTNVRVILPDCIPYILLKCLVR